MYPVYRGTENSDRFNRDPHYTTAARTKKAASFDAAFFNVREKRITLQQEQQEQQQEQLRLFSLLF
jgi:hypothetical protein